MDSFPTRMATDSFVSKSVIMRKQEADGQYCAWTQAGSSKHFYKCFKKEFVATVISLLFLITIKND